MDGTLAIGNYRSLKFGAKIVTYGLIESMHMAKKVYPSKTWLLYAVQQHEHYGRMMRLRLTKAGSRSQKVRNDTKAQYAKEVKRRTDPKG